MEEDVKNGIFLCFRNVQISERLLHILPYRYGANGDLGIIEVTSEDNENHHVPKFQAEHDGRGEGESDEGPDILDGQPRKSPPPIPAPNNDINKL